MTKYLNPNYILENRDKNKHNDNKVNSYIWIGSLNNSSLDRKEVEGIRIHLYNTIADIVQYEKESIAIYEQATNNINEKGTIESCTTW